MARHKEFDETEALDKAMELFWSQGYERTSIQDLCEQMELHRGSIYAAFGDKNRLFLACLDRFCENAEDRYFSILAEPGPARDRLERFYEKIIDFSVDNAALRRGCFVTNTAMEVAAADPDVAKRVETYYMRMEELFYRFLQEAKADGELKDGHDPARLARFLLNTKQGLHVLAKTAGDRTVLVDVYSVAVSAIF